MPSEICQTSRHGQSHLLNTVRGDIVVRHMLPNLPGQSQKVCSIITFMQWTADIYLKIS